MRALDSFNAAAVAAGSLVERQLISITAKDFSTGDPVTGRFWNDIGLKTLDYVDGETLSTVSGDFAGGGSLLAIDDIPFTSTIEIRTINATLSQVNDVFLDLVRGYNLKGGPVQIHRTLFDPVTRAQSGAAYCRFLGFVDGVSIVTPVLGNDGSITLALMGHTRELTRASADKASAASQKLRLSSDTFYDDMDVVGGWPYWWGEAKGQIASNKTTTSTSDLSSIQKAIRG